MDKCIYGSFEGGQGFKVIMLWVEKSEIGGRDSGLII